MREAIRILFNTNFEGKPLFKRQLDLVQDLLDTEGSHYYIEKKDEHKYGREAIRLKTLISQLLSSTVKRNIPTGFPESLNVVIQKKIKNQEQAEQIVDSIIEDLKIKNENAKNDIKQPSIFDQLKKDFDLANYTAIITANPLEIELDTIKEGFSLRKLFVGDFLNYISRSEFTLKKYRLLLPLEQTCHLFWKGLKNVVLGYIKQNEYDNDLMSLLDKKYYNQYNEPDLFSHELPFEEYAERLTSSLITSLNNEGSIVVFWHTSPLFHLPTIVMDPADLKRSKICSLVDSDNEEPFIHNYSINETILWRLFVWDRIKTKQHSGKRIDFITAMNDVTDI